MTVRELYGFAIEKGMELDPRGRDALLTQMDDLRAEYEGLDARGKDVFDRERLRNPFGDTRIVCGDPDAPVCRILCGIDIGGAEVVMADAMARRGRPVDLVVGHHTGAIGGALGSRLDTIWPQVQMLTDFGVPAHRAEKLVRRDSQGEQ